MRSLFGNLHTPSSFSPLSGQPPGRPARGSGLGWLLVCVLAGALQAASLTWPLPGWGVPGLTPGQPSGWLQIASLALLVLALQHAGGARAAAWRGWLFATAWLVGTFWWLFVSMHTYGGLAAWLAALAVLALAAFLALYYAVAASLLVACAPRSRSAQAVLFAAVWTLAELARGRWLTGFPWGAGGYAQVDLMAAWAPWVGVYGMGALAALLAYALASLLTGLGNQAQRWLLGPVRQSTPGRRPGGRHLSVGQPGLVGSWLGLLLLGALLLSLFAGERWRDLGQRGTAASGELRVWLLQGNIPQDQKFEPGTGLAQALSWYPQQVLEATRAGADAPQLVVAPETAIPLLPRQLGAEFWQPLLGGLAQQAGGAQPVGAMVGLPLGSYEQGYTNSAWGISPGSAARALSATEKTLPAEPGFHRYDKHHLVPFGEFVPPLFRWFIDLMRIPLGDFDRGGLAQAPWVWAGQRIAANICYEDLFGEELAAGFADPASAPTVLVNLSNIGWFGDTVAIDQHLQISRLRALELGRPMLRATNTGATAVIDHRGVVTQQLPRLTRGRLAATVQGRSGLTPYAQWASRWGLWPLWGLCLAVVALAAVRRGSGAHGRRARAA